MKLAIIGSRGITEIDLTPYVPPDCNEIISGGAKGIDTVARGYAKQHGIKLTEILPDRKRHGRGAFLRRNDIIVKRADQVLAIWDGKSRGTRDVIERCEKTETPCRKIII